MNHFRTRALFASLSLFAITSLCAARGPQGSFQRTLQVTGPVDLQVLTHSGDITIHPGPAGTVAISAKIFVGDNWFSGDKSAEISRIENNPPIRQSGNSIQIDYPGIRNVSIDFDITVPSDTTVHTESASGDQTVEGLHSNVNLQSGSGDMRLRDLTGDLRLHTGSGDVEVRDITGSLTAGAGSGDIRVEAKDKCSVRVHTGSGNIELHNVNGALQAEAGSGDLRIDGAQTDAWDIRTGSGNIDLHLPNTAAFDLDASTSSGRLVVDHPVSMMMQGNIERSHHEVNGKVRGGGMRLTVHTGSGDVHIS